MNKNFWHAYPIVSAGVLAASTVLFLLNGYQMFDGAPDSPSVLLKLQLRLALAGFLWILGCGLVSRTNQDTWTKGLLCSLLFLPGLLLLIFLTAGKNRHEVWLKTHPGLARGRSRRHYRHVKPLY